jgi:PAS domain S-box-containing protein
MPRGQDLSRSMDRINSLIHSTLNFDEIMQRVISEAAEVVGSETAAISLRRGDQWVVRYVHGFGPEVIGTTMDDQQEPHAVRAIETRESVVIRNAFTDRRVNREHMQEQGIQSVLVVPLVTQDEVVGVLCFNRHKAGTPFQKSHVDFAGRLAASVSLAVRNARLCERLQTELRQRQAAELEFEQAHEQFQVQTEELRAANEELQAQQEELRAQTEELRKTAHDLRESEQRHRSLFENMLEGYAYCRMLFDSQGRPTDFVYLAVNDAFTKLTGLEDVVGRRVTEVIPGIRQSHPELLETYGRVATTGQPERFELEFKPLGIWLAISVYSPAKGCFTAVFDNITERKEAAAALQLTNEQLQAQTEELEVQAEELRAQAEELTSTNAALREAHERAAWLARFPEENPNPVLRVSVEGAVLYCNPAAVKLPGWLCRTGRALEEPFLSVVARAMTEDREVRQDVELGETSYLVWAVPFPSERYVNLYGRDITERKRAEKALRASEERFRVSVESMVDGFAIFSAVRDQRGKVCDFRYEFINEAGAQMNQRPRADHLGRTVLELLPAHENTELFRKYIRLIEESGAFKEEAVEYEDVYGSGQRLKRVFEIEAAKLGDGFAVTWRDRTAIERAKEALRELNATLEGKVAQRTAELEHRARQLQKLALELSRAEDRERKRLAVILHEDLQQQIAGARFHLSLLNNPVRREAPQAIVDKVGDMLKEAIDKSRNLSHELSPAVLQRNDLAEVLHWLARQMQTKHGLAVQVGVSGAMVLQLEDLTTFLYRTAQELLFNVIKHARVREARIRVRRLGRYVCLSVSDRGPGFDPHLLKETAGFGLLSIRERVELLGGRMRIRSAKGEGSTFHIVVPDEELTAGDIDFRRAGGWGLEDQAEPGAPTPPKHRAQLRVLVVDDHEVVRQGLAALLRDDGGIDVIGEAADGRQAVDLAWRLRPDVVIMDVLMPLMNGDEATRQIKRQMPRTRVVALSLHDDVDIVQKMRQAGAEDFVLKTASARELLAAVRGRKSDS